MTPAQAATVEDVETAKEECTCDRLKSARKIVRKNMYWAMGFGVVPVPIIDLVGIAAFQAKAIKELSDLYEIPFSEHKVKNVIATLLSGLGAVALGQALAGSIIKSIPIIGQATTFAAMPLMAGGVTYAFGKVFIQHFESGGTFLDLDPETVKAYFKEQLSEGLEAAAEMAKSKDAAGADSAKKAAKS